MSLAGGCAILGAAIAPAAIAVAWLGSGQLSMDSVRVAAVGGGVCFIAGVTALVVTFVSHRAGAPVQGMLVAMLFRMGLPLGAVVIFSSSGGQAAGRAATTILGVYLVGLVVETAISLRMIGPAGKAAKAA